MGPQTIPFNRKATRWLGAWLDSRLSFREHSERGAERARRAEGGLRSIVTRHGVPPIAARRLQEARVSSTLLYGAEVTWGESILRGPRRLLNRIARATLGALPSSSVAL